MFQKPSESLEIYTQPYRKRVFVGDISTEFDEKNRSLDF